MTKEERDAVQARCVSIDNIIIGIERELRMLRTHLDILTKVCKTESSSEIPNNCEHITEDGVTCAKYPACDDCLDNPLNKVKGSERLVKGSDEPTISKMEQVEDEPQTERPQGEWKPKNHHTDYCGNCGFEETQWRTADYNFCPSCGARMKGVDDEHTV